MCVCLFELIYNWKHVSILLYQGDMLGFPSAKVTFALSGAATIQTIIYIHAHVV